MTDKKFKLHQVKTIQGGKDPTKLLRELILKLGFDPASVEVESDDTRIRWMIPYSESEDVEIILDSPKSSQDATIYIGINVCSVPIRRVTETLAVALELADGLIGAKVSLVGRFLVLSVTVPAYSTSFDELEYMYKLVIAQRQWFLNLLIEELGLESVPVD